MQLKQLVQSLFNALGFDIRRSRNGIPPATPVELSESERRFVSYIVNNSLSMSTWEGLWATAMACTYVINSKIDGDFVECGVWRGGNAILAAMIFTSHNCDKKIYLFDTFEGMTAPSQRDRDSLGGKLALAEYLRNSRSDHNAWCYASVSEVEFNFRKAGLLNENIVFVKGDVEHTLCDCSQLPEKIALLRLDTDWYASTKKELEILYPRVCAGGVLIIDDYGHWAGAKEAVDEYFSADIGRPLLQYVDYTRRMGIKR